jgi:lipopolysaccharide transport system permease protein
MHTDEGAADSASVHVLEIRPRSGWSTIDLPELWSRRELLLFLIWRDITVRYRQTFFGAAWAVIQPVLPMLVFTVVLGRLSGIAPAGVDYPIFVLTGLVPWLFVSQSVTGASMSLVGAANLIQKVYFPRLLLPFGAVGGRLPDLGIGMVVLLLAATVAVGPPPITVIALLPLVVLAIAIAIALGTWLAAVNVRYRDVGHAVPFLIQVLMFLTPVFYQPDLVPPSLRGLYALNPLVGLVDGFRWSLLGVGQFPAISILISVAVTSVLLVAGVAYFRRVERTFADVI